MTSYESDPITVSLVACQLRYRVEGLYRLSAHPGSLWRGAFGAALKRLCCRRFPRCQKACQEPTLCAYGAIFETPQSESSQRLGDVKQAPRPFAIYPFTRGPALLEPGAELLVNWTIWGVARNLFPYLLLTWRELGLSGLNPGRVKAQLTEVVNLADGITLFKHSEPVFNPPQPLRMNLAQLSGSADVELRTLTPLRIVADNRLVGRRESGSVQFPARDFLRALLRRIEVNFPETAAYLMRFYARLDEAEAGVHQGEAVWTETVRWSNRQQTHLLMGGLMGWCRWKNLPADWLPILKLGEWIQAGKGTTLGLGKYSLSGGGDAASGSSA